MPRLPDAYTRYPRPLLWLVRGGELVVRGDDRRPVVREIPSFYVSKLPVSNEQFEAYDPGWLRGDAAPGDTDPAVGMRWDEAAGYCAWYAEVARKPMRLPTAEEWRWACFGDRSLPDAGDLDDLAWHAGNAGGHGGRVPPLASKRPNHAGLYGMLGGVWDWTSSDGKQRAGDGDPVAGKLVCGGSFLTPRTELRAWLAAGEPWPDGLARARSAAQAAPDIGFRVVKPLRG